MRRRHFHKTLMAAVAGIMLSTGGAYAAGYPSETIRLIVPFKPGGGTDTIARALAASLEKIAGQAVVVENVPGSAGINGMLALAKSKPDGYTLAINGSTDVSGPAVFRDNVPFQLSDFSCAGGVFNTPAWILSHKKNGFKDLGDFITAAKAKPGKLAFGITGKLSATDFVAATIKGTSDIDVKVVNFGGGGPLKKAILANQVDAGIIISPVLMPDVVAGELNVLAAAGDLSGIVEESLRGTRHMRDWGADLDVAVIRGIFMPSGVPEADRQKMEEMIHAAVTGPEFTKFANTFGFAPYTQSGADYCARLPKEVVEMQEIKDKYLSR